MRTYLYHVSYVRTCVITELERPTQFTTYRWRRLGTADAAGQFSFFVRSSISPEVQLKCSLFTPRRHHRTVHITNHIREEWSVIRDLAQTSVYWCIRKDKFDAGWSKAERLWKGFAVNYTVYTCNGVILKRRRARYVNDLTQTACNNNKTKSDAEKQLLSKNQPRNQRTIPNRNSSHLIK